MEYKDAAEQKMIATFANFLIKVMFLNSKDGKEIFRHMGGYIDLENKIPIQGNELYNIYSCSRVMTVTAAMQLWEKGKFSLEDDLADYLPAFREMRPASGRKPCRRSWTMLLQKLSS